VTGADDFAVVDFRFPKRFPVMRAAIFDRIVFAAAADYHYGKAVDLGLQRLGIANGLRRPNIHPLPGCHRERL
jgi:hypothetical protein